MRHILLLVVLVAVSTANSGVGQSPHSRSPQFDYVALDGSAASHTWAAAINERGAELRQLGRAVMIRRDVKVRMYVQRHSPNAVNPDLERETPCILASRVS